MVPNLALGPLARLVIQALLCSTKGAGSNSSLFVSAVELVKSGLGRSYAPTSTRQETSTLQAGTTDSWPILLPPCHVAWFLIRNLVLAGD